MSCDEELKDIITVYENMILYTNTNIKGKIILIDMFDVGPFF
jgi:hypothetical protein